MKLSTRLKVAFCTLVIMPIVLFSFTAWLLLSFQAKTMDRYYDITGTTISSFSNPMVILNKLTNNIYNEVKKSAQEHPTRFQNIVYLQELSEELEEKASSIIVRCNGYVVYASPNLNLEDILSFLPEYGEYTEDEQNGIYYGGKVQTLIKQHDFVDDYQNYYSVSIVTSMETIQPMVKRVYAEVLIAIVIILLIVSGVLMMWIYRATILPLNRLKEATQKIKEGNLDFTLEAGNDEIGSLCRDFEEMRKRLKENAEEKIRFDMENKELISNISHDLKTPITTIKGYVEGLMDGVADTKEKSDKYIKTIYNKANDMDKLIDELSFYSKIDTNRIPYTFSKINVARYFADCAEELSLELESKGIEFTYFDYTEGDNIIIADAEQLKRVVNNIVSNSVKYMADRRGVINVRIKDAGDFIQIELEDNGKGINKDELPYIFDRFYRADSSRNSSQGGSGIGLSIVKKIIDDHGGRIWAESKEGTGTVMCIVLRKYIEPQKEDTDEQDIDS